MGTDRPSGTEPKSFNKKGVTIGMPPSLFLQFRVFLFRYQDENPVCMSLPETKYHIYIKNLPSNIEVEVLSDRFAWDIYDIVMNPSPIGKLLSTECWLKNANDENEVNAFIQRWNGKNIGGSIIECKKEEDELELCNKFRYGRCTKTGNRCHWEHIECTANGKCMSTCPYGHPAGMKAERPIVDSKSYLPSMILFYFIKISRTNGILILSYRSDHKLSNQNNGLSISCNTNKSCSTVAFERKECLY